jgi:hypothetical protein
VLQIVKTHGAEGVFHPEDLLILIAAFDEASILFKPIARLKAIALAPICSNVVGTSPEPLELPRRSPHPRCGHRFRESRWLSSAEKLPQVLKTSDTTVRCAPRVPRERQRTIPFLFGSESRLLSRLTTAMPQKSGHSWNLQSLYRRDMAARVLVEPICHGVNKQPHAAGELAARGK